MITRVKLFPSMLLCLLLPAMNASRSQQPFDPHYDAERGLALAKRRAFLEHKRVLLDFGANWCAPCVSLDQLFKTDPQLKRSLDAGYVLVKVPVGIEKDSRPTFAIRRQYPKFNLVPHLLVLTEDGKELWDQPVAPLMSDMQKELWDRQAVLAFLDHWSHRE